MSKVEKYVGRPNCQAAASPAGDDQLGDDTRAFRAKAIHRKAQNDPQHGTGQDRKGHHDAFLFGGEFERLADLGTKRTQDRPDHEADIKIQKRRDERGQVSGFFQVLQIHKCQF